MEDLKLYPCRNQPGNVRMTTSSCDKMKAKAEKNKKRYSKNKRVANIMSDRPLLDKTLDNCIGCEGLITEGMG